MASVGWVLALRYWNNEIHIVCCGKTGGQQVAAGELGDGVLARSGSGVSRLGASWYVDDIGL